MVSGGPRSKSIPDISALSRIERTMLEHVRRYRMTTRRGWRGAWELRMFDHAALARAVRRLVTARVLRRRVLFGSIHAFELEHKGAAMFGLPPEYARPFSHSATVRAYAQLLYATTGSRRWVLADPSQLRASLPDRDSEDGQGYRRPAGWRFFFDPEQPADWCQLRVDQSFSTNPNRIAQRLHRSALKLFGHAYWKQQIADGRLSLAVITASRRRAERIQKRYSRYGLSDELSLRIMVAPALIPLLRNH